MKRAPLLLSGLLLLALAGCADVEALKTENALLRQQLEQQAGTEAARIEHWQREAVIAQACDYLVKVCPANMAQPGREALASGRYSGGGVGFWLLVALKMLALGLGIGGAISASWWGFERFVAPAQAAAETARTTIQESESRAAVAQQRMTQYETQSVKLAGQLAELRQLVEQEQAKLQTSQQQLESIEAAKQALGGF